MKQTSGDWSWKPEKSDRKSINHGNKVFREAMLVLASQYKPSGVTNRDRVRTDDDAAASFLRAHERDFGETL